jgi:integrase
MPARPKGPWLRAGRGYYAKINGKQFRLGTDNFEAAWEEFYRLMGKAGLPTTAIGRASPSVHEILDRFLLWAHKYRKPMTSAWYKQFVDDFIERSPLVVKQDAARLRPYHIQEWIDRHEGWSTTTQNSAASTIKRAYSWAVEQGLIEADPVRSLKKAKRQRRMRILSDDDWRVVVAGCFGFRSLLELLKIQRETGARPQELRLAEVRHFDEAGQCLRFPADESKGGIARVIILTSTALWIVKDCIAGRKSGFIFRSDRGTPWTRAGLHTALVRLQTRCKKDFNKTIKLDAYTGRHSYATDALTNGVDAVTVGYLMGHTDPSMVAKVYSHLDQKPDYLRQAAEKASGRQRAQERTDEAASETNTRPPFPVGCEAASLLASIARRSVLTL